MMKLRAVGELIPYLASGLIALCLAAWISSQFLTHAISQTLPSSGPPSSAQVPQGAAAPPPVQPGHAPIPSMPPTPQSDQAPQPMPMTPGAGSVPNGSITPMAHEAQDLGQVPQPMPVEPANPEPLPNTTRASKKADLTPAPLIGASGPVTPVLSRDDAIAKAQLRLAEIIEDYSYNANGKRDPFIPFERPSSGPAAGPLWPLQKFDLDQLRLIGVIWDVSSPKAMILDPTGKGYVVKVNERVGRNNGYVARIREGEIVVVESVTSMDGRLSYTTKLLKIQPQ